MPFVRIALAGSCPPADQIARLQRQTTDLMARLLGKRPEVTAVTVQASPASHWSAGGEPLADSAGLAQMEAFITAGTNSGEEKAAFIRAAHALLLSVLGGTCSPVYVMVHELPATDWGYDGETQAARQRTTPAPL